MEDFHIITTKQARFVNAILEANGMTPPPPERMFDLENPFGKKPQVLLELLRRYGGVDDGSVEIHFVEDRMETLLACVECKASGIKMG
jgi:hypothetical protein